MCLIDTPLEHVSGFLWFDRLYLEARSGVLIFGGSAIEFELLPTGATFPGSIQADV